VDEEAADLGIGQFGDEVRVPVEGDVVELRVEGDACGGQVHGGGFADMPAELSKEGRILEERDEVTV